MNQIHKRIDENNTTPVSILCANIHNFKHYNVEYGYATGDVILGEIGKRLLTMDENRFKSFRIDGNEFLIMTWGEYEKAEIEELLRYIRHMIEEPIIDGKQIYKLDVTFSYAMYPQDTDKLDQLLGFAETSLLKAKNSV
jgi:diguanylate cyclase (GGDEF)-like protein